MSGKQTVKAEGTEELMEAMSLYSNFAEDIAKAIDNLSRNEELDHRNDKIRNEAISFLLKSMEAYNSKDYEGMQKYLHAAMQRLHEQEGVDFADDKPRADVRLQLSEIRLKAIMNTEKLKALIGRFRRKNACPTAK